MFEIDFDARQIECLGRELDLTDKQVRYAMTRALGRTTKTLRAMAARGLKSELDVKRLAYLRKRLKETRLRNSTREGAQLWFGLNDMPVSALRGKINSGGSDGASFAGMAGHLSFVGGFVAKSRNGRGRTIFTRKGRARLPLAEARVPVEREMLSFIERDLFAHVGAIFWKNFERDMNARSRFGVGGGRD